MDENKRKITFQNKEDSSILNSESKYVLTAENVNEIKNVVNTLSDELANRLRFNHIFKFVRFNVPNTLKEDCEYSFLFELSKDKSFSKDVTTISFRNNALNFNIFENNKWVALDQNRKITKADIDKVIKADISNIVSDENKCYFGRCRWTNETTNEAENWQGFALSVFEYNDKDFDKKIVSDLYIKGNTVLNEKETDVEYNVFVKNQSGNEIKVTNTATFKSIFNKCSFTNNKLLVGNFHNTEYDIIEASFTYNNIKYTTFLNIIINPILLEKIEIVKDFNKVIKDQQYEFQIKAFWSDGSSKIVTNDASKSLTLGKCELNENIILGKGCYDAFGALTIKYQDEDFPELENIEVNTYLNYEVPKFKNFIIDFPTTLKGDSTDKLTYSINLIYDNNVQKNITNDVKIKLIDCTEFVCNNGIITINANEMNKKKNVSVLITYSDPDCNNLNYSEVFNVLLNPKVLIDIDVEFIQNNENVFEVKENSSVSYKIIGIYNDGTTKNITSNYDISLLTNTTCTINKSRKLITIGEHEFTNIAIFKITYSSNNVVFEKTRYLGINSIYVTQIKASSDIINNDKSTEWETVFSTPKKIYFIGVNSDQSEISITDNVTINLAAGNPNLIKSIDKNIISFNEPNIAKEAVCFIATYKNPLFASEIKTTHFVISVSKN